MEAEQVRVEYVSLSELQRWPRNPKLHDHDSLGQSVKRFGFIQPLTLDERTQRLVAGHGRLETLQQMKAKGDPPPARVLVGADGDWQVPVIRGVAFESEADAEAYLLADNRLSEKGGWDEAGLADMLRSLQDNHALAGVGWDDKEVAAVLKTAEAMAAPEPAPTVGERFDTFQAGEIKQIVLYFDGAEYDAVLARVQKVMADFNCSSHTELFLRLLAQHEAAATQSAA